VKFHLALLYLTVERPTSDDGSTVRVDVELVGPRRAAVESVDEGVIFREPVAVLGRHVTDLRLGRLVLGNVEAVATVLGVGDEPRFFVILVGDRDDDQRRPCAWRHAVVHCEHRKPEAVVAFAVDGVLRADDAALVDVESDSHAARDAVFDPPVTAFVPVRRCHLLTNANNLSRLKDFDIRLGGLSVNIKLVLNMARQYVYAKK